MAKISRCEALALFMYIRLYTRGESYLDEETHKTLDLTNQQFSIVMNNGMMVGVTSEDIINPPGTLVSIELLCKMQFKMKFRKGLKNEDEGEHDWWLYYVSLESL